MPLQSQGPLQPPQHCHPQRDSKLAVKDAAQRRTCRRHVDLDRPGFLRLDDVLAVIPVSRATWYAGVKSGEYPMQVQIGKRSVAWKTQDIKSLVEKLAGPPVGQ